MVKGVGVESMQKKVIAHFSCQPNAPIGQAILCCWQRSPLREGP